MTVQFRLFGPSSFRLQDRPLWISGRPTFADRPHLAFLDRPLWTPIFTGKSLFAFEFRIIGNGEMSSSYNDIIKYIWMSLSGFFPAQIKIIFIFIEFYVLNFATEFEGSLHEFVDIVWIRVSRSKVKR